MANTLSGQSFLSRWREEDHGVGRHEMPWRMFPLGCC